MYGPPNTFPVLPKQSHGGGDDDHGDHGNDHPEVTIPHGSCKDEDAGATMVHPRRGRDEDCTQHKYGSLPPDERKEDKAGRMETEVSVFVLGSKKEGEEKPANGTVDEVSLKPQPGVHTYIYGAFFCVQHPNFHTTYM